MKIAYLILAHRHFDHLQRLVDRLDSGNVFFFIHIDKNVNDAAFDSLRSCMMGRTNVFFVKRYRCHWGGYGIVRATWQGLLEIKEKQICYDYVCLMSGQDYPIKSNNYICSFFQKHEGKSFIHALQFPQPSWSNEGGGYDRIRNWYFVTKTNQYGFPNKMFRKRKYLNRIFGAIVGSIVPERKLPADWDFYGGAQFWALHKRHVDYTSYRHKLHFPHVDPQQCSITV